MECSAFELTKLSELLYPNNDEDSDEDEQRVKAKPKSRPYDLAKPKIVKEEDKVDSKEKCNNEYDRLNECIDEDVEGLEDWRRKCPQWDMVYKQSVSPSDVYLQMSGKTCLTSGCEEMVFSIHMPGDNGKNIDIKLTKEHLELTSQHYRLSIPLPHPVDPQKGDAKWDPDVEKLKLTLVMQREFDFINF